MSARKRHFYSFSSTPPPESLIRKRSRFLFPFWDLPVLFASFNLPAATAATSFVSFHFCSAFEPPHTEKKNYILYFIFDIGSMPPIWFVLNCVISYLLYVNICSSWVFITNKLALSIRGLLINFS